MKIKPVLIICFLLLVIPLIKTASPPSIIYKTKADYKEFVPVDLSEDKTRILSFPDINDMPYEKESAYITELEQGYLLDERGITQNTVFLNVTYEEYSQLKEIPSEEEIFEMVIDKDPFLEIYDCGSKYSFENEIEELNGIIKNDELDKRCENLLKKDNSKSLMIYWITGIFVVLILIIIGLVFRIKSKKAE